ncbi:hypothetical protein NQ048_11185, partial [Corynebacterium sp. 209RC1]
MAIDSVPLGGPTTRMARRSCAGPLAVLTAAVALAALGTGLQPPVQRGDDLSAVPDRQSMAVESAQDTVPLAAEAPADEAWRDATGGPLSRWAWSGIE